MRPLAEQLEGFDTCVLSDALESIGRLGAVSGIVPAWVCGRVVGPAVTVRLRKLEPGESPPPGPHLGARAIESGKPGDVIVIEHGGRTDSAGWGGLLSAAAATSGIAGVVIDGACRDVDESADLAFPVFARSATPITARGRSVEVETEGSITIGGVRVHPGDLVVADRSGVVFVPHQLVEEVIIRATGLVRRESRMLAALREGVPATRVMDKSYDAMLDDQGQGEA